MGIVYRARHVPLDREVALKVIAPEFSADEEFRRRFQREFRAAASIQHPNVVPIYHAGEEDGLLYVTMRFVKGTDLARLLHERGAARARRWRRASSPRSRRRSTPRTRAGIVHRDVKPANVLLEGEHALLTDFGLMKNLRSNTQITDARSVIGTFDYAAPEQLRGGARWTPGPTSTRSAACSTRRSPARSPTRARPPRRRCSRTSTRRRRRC